MCDKGCTGFIASHLVLELLRWSDDVIVRGSVRRRGDSDQLIALMSASHRTRFEEVREREERHTHAHHVDAEYMRSVSEAIVTRTAALYLVVEREMK